MTRSKLHMEQVLAAIRNAWIMHPHLRLGQLIENATRDANPRRPLFFCEDAELRSALIEYYKRRQNV